MSASEGVFLTEGHVAMFCRECGIAFGPVFDSEREADDFLLWFESPDRHEVMKRLAITGPDDGNMRHFDQVELAQIYDEWKEARVEATQT